MSLVKYCYSYYNNRLFNEIYTMILLFRNGITSEYNRKILLQNVGLIRYFIGLKKPSNF